MDTSRLALPNLHSSPACRFLRQTRGPPPPSPAPQVPDVTDPISGLEWFEMTASNGASSSEQGVPSSPLVLASANIHSSPLQLCSPIHLSAGHTDVSPQPEGGGLHSSQQQYSVTTRSNCAYFWRASVFWESKHSKRGSKPSPEMTRRKRQKTEIEEQRTN